MLYRILRPLIFMLDPELMNKLANGFGLWLADSRISRIIGLIYDYEDPALQTEVCGIKFRNPVGLAPGFDKTGRLVEFLGSLGFSFVEVGSVTPLPQPGNPKPRSFRLSADQAIVNRMGFNSEGIAAIARRLGEKRRSAVVAVNIGKNRTTPNEAAAEDYKKGFLGFAGLADFIVINISSPNTPGLRSLQDKEPLTRILGILQELNREQPRPKPIFVKIAPDLTESQLDDIIDAVRESGISGIVAVNTTVSRDGLKTSPDRLGAIGEGGLSGRPLRQKATDVIRYIYKKSGGAFPIIGVGGIFSAEDAYEKIKAGASLVEFYTGLVYEGPGLVKKINKGLSRLLKRDGFSSMREAVGKDAR